MARERQPPTARHLTPSCRWRSQPSSVSSHAPVAIRARRYQDGYSPGFSAPSSYGEAYRYRKVADARSPRPLACDFRRLRFSRNASFNRSCRGSLPGRPCSYCLATDRIFFGSVLILLVSRRFALRIVSPGTHRCRTPDRKGSRGLDQRQIGNRRPHRARLKRPRSRLGHFGVSLPASRLRKRGPCGKDRRRLVEAFRPIPVSGHAAVAQW